MGMTPNLLAVGYDVLAYDVATPPLERFVGQGGRQASHPAQIGAACQRVLVMVVHGAQVEEVVQGEHGLLQTMTRGTILVCSTIALAELHRVTDRAAAQGVTVIDSPVSGGVEGAAEGTLTIFCGGEPEVVEAHRPVAVQDLSAAVDSGRSVQQAMPVTSLSLALYQLAHDKLGGLRTSTEVVRYFLED